MVGNSNGCAQDTIDVELFLSKPRKDQADTLQALRISEEKKGTLTFVLDALARKHSFNVRANGGKGSFSHHLDNSPSNDLG